MTRNAKPKRIAILGASGYTGAELVRLLAHHPGAEIAALTADRSAGKTMGDVFPHLGGLSLPRLVGLDDLDLAALDVDAVFCALPHGASQPVVAGLLSGSNAVRVIDLSADFRLKNADLYDEWYGAPHGAPDLLSRAVYGLTEFARDDVRHAQLIACPGCYPTTSAIPLVPLLDEGCIEPDGIIIDAKSGVTGAGRAEKQANLFGEVSGSIHPYGIARHRHAPEIDQTLSEAAGTPVQVTFTPHLVPMNRGILATMYVPLAAGAAAADAREILHERFADEPFVRVLEEGAVPATRMVRGSNHCVVNVFADRIPGRAIVVSVTDNLVKGASGQAVQNFNVAFGFSETEALQQEALFP